MKRTGPTNPHLRGLIIALEKKKTPFWRRVAELLSKPTRKRIIVNVGKFNRLDGKIFIVPGKVLGAGTLEKPVTVAAWYFTPQARKKIEEAGGRTLSIEELAEKIPDGKEVVIVT